jgi:pantothenate kinase
MSRRTIRNFIRTQHTKRRSQKTHSHVSSISLISNPRIVELSNGDTIYLRSFPSAKIGEFL